MKKNEIDIEDWRKLRNTAISLHVTENDVIEAVNEVGPKYDDVQRYLKSYHSPLMHRPDRQGRRL
jgi:hypothetical protein